MLKFLLKSKDVLYQVSSDLGEVSTFYSSFSDAGQKALPLPVKVCGIIGISKIQFYKFSSTERVKLINLSSSKLI